MRAVSLVPLLLAACSFNPDTGSTSRDGDLPVDARFGEIDAAPGTPDAAPGTPDAAPSMPDAAPGPDANPCDTWTKAPLLFDECNDIDYETADLILGGAGTYSYNTDQRLLRQQGVAGTRMPPTVDIGDATAIVVGRFQIDALSSLRVVGSRPLLVISWNDILLNGNISVLSRPSAASPDAPDTDAVGAGADPAACLAAENGTQDANGGSGGGGGGFGSVGGKGGNGRVTNQNTEGGNGGAAAMVPPSLRGGCPGGAGGQGNGSGPGAGGHGGGAIYLNARTSITLNGIITGGGSGGHRSVGGRSAGGGGGSGGLIGLEAATITLLADARLAANGGGGGGGGNNSSSASESGQSGRANNAVAAGGLGEGGNIDPRGDGGDGGYLDVDTAAAKLGASGERGGGGGGGGVGFVILSTLGAPTIDAAAIVTPAYTTVISQ